MIISPSRMAPPAAGASSLRLARAGRVLEKWGRMAQHRKWRRLGGALYRLALVLDPGAAGARREIAKARPRGPDEAPHLFAMAIGTTGTCNASCAHCPTGKPSTAHSPRGTMPIALFRKIIDGIAEEGLGIEHIGFGLFGDGLVDPLVVERARYLRATLPDAPLSVNTNGAAYDSARHAALYPYVTTLTLHCESLLPETYDALMTPLRAKNVFPKYETILRDFPGKVRISVPVSRINRSGLSALREWFMIRGAREVSFDALASRCVRDRTEFDRLALDPVRIRCPAAVVNNLIVDCDGAILPCCNDFAREQPIGNLAVETVGEALTNGARRAFAEKMRNDEHDEIPLCSRCYGDIRTADFPFGPV